MDKGSAKEFRGEGGTPEKRERLPAKRGICCVLPRSGEETRGLACGGARQGLEISVEVVLSRQGRDGMSMVEGCLQSGWRTVHWNFKEYF